MTVRALACVFAAGCTVGAPPGFSSGDHWTFPLVGPLEDGLLITPVKVRDQGPYLFLIDPDANVSAIDQQVLAETKLLVGSGPRRIDESETGRARLYAELRELHVSGLTIDRRDVMVFPNGLYDTEGRHINGVLGRDVLADSLVFGFDRDQGIATLSTPAAFREPADAVAIRYEVVSSRSSDFIASRAAIGTERNAGDPLPSVSPRSPRGGPGNLMSPQQTAQDEARRENNDAVRSAARANPREKGVVTPLPRRLAQTQIGDARFAMHLDLGAVTSQLPERQWGKAGLEPVEAKLRLIDEAAEAREVRRAGVAREVALGDARAAQVAFVPFVDKRWKTEGVEGALGLDYFQPYAVYAHWDKGTYYLKRRGDAAALTAARMGRWGAAIPACPHAGCITAELFVVNGGVGIEVVRDAEAKNRPLEVYLGVRGKAVAPLVVELSAGVDRLTTVLPAEYAGAELVVLDVSPFPRACAGDRGCVAILGGPIKDHLEISPQHVVRPAAPTGDAVTPEAEAAKVKMVAIDRLRRVAGDAVIAPGAAAQEGGGPGAAVVKVCLTASGDVDSTKVNKSSGVEAYDRQLERTIKDTWRFEPVVIGGANAPVCTTATFLPAR